MTGQSKIAIAVKFGWIWPKWCRRPACLLGKQAGSLFHNRIPTEFCGNRIILTAGKFPMRALLAAAALGLSAVAGWGETATVPSVTWTENLSGALARAGNELKPVLLVFSSPNCPWCMRLKSETLAEKEVLAALEGFICVGIDTSRDAKTAQEFQVRGVPMTVILSGDGRPQSVASFPFDRNAAKTQCSI